MLLDPYLLERAYLEERRLVRRDNRPKMRNRRYNALRKSYQRLIENPYINYKDGEMLILSDTVTEQGEAKFYRTSREECRLEEPGNVLCRAFWEGYPCWHKASLEIVETYLRIKTYLRIENPEQKQTKKTVQRQTVKTVAGVDSSGVAGVDSFKPSPNSFDHPQNL